jgi:hypothetical protein
MGLDPTVRAREERAQRAALRDGLLQCGRLLGWRARTVIVLTEQLARRPWKRCTRGELDEVLDELLPVLLAFKLRDRAPLAAMADRGRPTATQGGRHEHRC